MDVFKNQDDYFYWQGRRNYFDLMRDFINNDICVDDFVYEFTTLSSYCAKQSWTDNKSFNKGNLQLDKFKGFSPFILEISLQCEFFEPDPNVRKDFEVSKEELRILVSKILIEIRKYLE